tara:strand:- start:7829 stop:8707 length:879 start_codon:yes stop_codon:yes gene_type:complete
MGKIKRILITGSNGQLGRSFRDQSKYFSNYNYFFADKKKLDISKFNTVKKFIEKNKINSIINCAAYTNVDKAEKYKSKADLINHLSVSNLVKLCYKKNIQLIQISTDYIFDGKKNSPYSENDLAVPINFYGMTKYKAEQEMKKYKLKDSLIVRTSWLYSNYENNFLNKILNKIKLNKPFFVVDDEIGSPTYAKDLARVILSILEKITNEEIEVFNFSSSNHCSRYEFATRICKIINSDLKILPTKSNNAKVERPKFSALNSSKISDQFDIFTKDWTISLRECLNHNYNAYEN